jgi:ferric-dicitrate binding protein FerR (iron transport regulator)
MQQMQDYTRYQAEGFAMDPDFIRWVFENRPEDRLFWEQWLLEYPHMEEIVEEARTILRSVKIKEAEWNEEGATQRMQEILLEAGGFSRRNVLARLPRWSYAAIAAGVIATGIFLYIHRLNLSVSGSMAYRVSADLPPKTDSTAEESNTGAGDRSIRLSDGSTVRLSPGSAIRFRRRFTTPATRDIYLSGEASFNVVKDPDKPFQVFSHELITRVLGTSFTIKASDSSGEITVVVLSGKVSVWHKPNDRDTAAFSHNKLTGVVLTPNQELVYARGDDKFQKVLIDKPLLVNPVAIKNAFLYEDTPVADVLEQLKNAFDIDIVYDREALKNCRISADLSDESIYKKLDLICKAMGAQYEVIDGVVTIQARPCK